MPIDEIKAKYVREGLLYSRNDLRRLFEFDSDDELKLFIKQLKKYRILKTKRFKETDEDEALIEDADEDYIDNGGPSVEMKFLFRFVGIVCCCNRVINVFPKYICSTNEPKTEMKQVLQVLLKYKKRWERDFFSYADEGDNEKINILSLMFFLLDDYSSYGLYQNEEKLLELNGEGRIEWQHTVDGSIPVIRQNKPYYVELITERKVNDESDFFYRLHASILTECSRQLEEAELTSVFGLPLIELSDESLDDFGDNTYITNSIENELSIQYDDHKQLILKAMLKFLQNDGKMLKGNSDVTFFGTRSFHAVWEDVCAQVFASQRNTKLDDLANSPTIDYSFINPATGDTELVELIRKPEWHIYSNVIDSKDTFRPDFLSFDLNTGQYIYYILDAKYYCPDWSGIVARKCPGVEDIAKQYLYFMSYQSFLSHHHVTDVKNYFLMPKEDGDIEDVGFVKLEILHGIFPNDIGIRKLPAKRLYDCYLKNPIETMELSSLG